MPVVQTFEKNLDTEERLAALAAAMNRLPANAVVRRLSDPGPASADPIPANAAAADIPPVSLASIAFASVGNPAAADAAPDASASPPGAASPAAPEPIASEPAVPGIVAPEPAVSGILADATPRVALLEAAPLNAGFSGAAPASAAPSGTAVQSVPDGSAATATATVVPKPDLLAVPKPDAVAITNPAPDPDPDAVPVPEPLVGLLPGGLRRGEAAALATRNQGPDYLALALLAEALKAGLWCAVIGVPELGLAALAGLLGSGTQRQAALDRLILVAEPGEQWAEITATLADGVDLLLTRPGAPVRAEIAQRVDARLRQGRSAGTRHSAALLVLGGWPTARLALRIARMDWTGLDGIGPTAGTGHLTAGRATVVAQGRATAGRPRVARVWLPDAAGMVRSLSDDPRTISDRPSQTGRNVPATPALTGTATALALVPAAASPTPAPASPAA